jgi:hypothetical protein
VGRHAKPHNAQEQPPESQEDSRADEHHPSRGRHAKDRQCHKGASGEQVNSVKLA